MVNETEEREIKVADYETEGVVSDNEGVDKKVLHPEIKGWILSKPPNVNYSDKTATWRSMGWNNIIVVSNELYGVLQNPISTF